MKKKIAKLLLLTIVAGTVLAGCGNAEGNKEENNGTNNETNNEAPGYEAADAVTVLNDVWTVYGEDEKFFAMGGDYNTPVDNAPGKVDVTSMENMDTMFGVPADAAAMADDGASLLHAMNANTFTGAVFHIKDAANIESFTDLVEENIKNRQWICGFPDKLTIAEIDGQYVAVAFGAADIMSTFEGHLKTVTGAELVVEENLAE